FDAVVRHRHRVLCVETKTRADDVEARAGWTLAKARRVFGNAVCVLFVHTGPADPRLRAAMFDHNPAPTAPNTHLPARAHPPPPRATTPVPGPHPPWSPPWAAAAWAPSQPCTPTAPPGP